MGSLLAIACMPRVGSKSQFSEQKRTCHCRQSRPCRAAPSKRLRQAHPQPLPSASRPPSSPLSTQDTLNTLKVSEGTSGEHNARRGRQHPGGTHSRRPASFKCCHQTSILRKKQTQPDTLLPPVALGRPASPVLAVPGAQPGHQWHVIGLSLGLPQHSSGGQSRHPRVQQRWCHLF